MQHTPNLYSPTEITVLSTTISILKAALEMNHTTIQLYGENITTMKKKKANGPTEGTGCRPNS